MSGEKIGESGLQIWVDMYNKADKERFDALLKIAQLEKQLQQSQQKCGQLDKALTFQLESLALSSTGRELLKSQQKLDIAVEALENILKTLSSKTTHTGYEWNSLCITKEALTKIKEGK